MASAFVTPGPLRASAHGLERSARVCRPRGPVMLIPPGPKRPEPPLSQEQLGPPGYSWDAGYPGTMKPGLQQDDCFPLDTVLESGVYENMKYQELDMYDIVDDHHTPDNDLLEWLNKEGRLLTDDGALEEEADKQIVGVTEEDLDFSEEDDKMLAFYSKQGEGSSVGASSDFGGIAGSSMEGGFD